MFLALQWSFKQGILISFFNPFHNNELCIKRTLAQCFRKHRHTIKIQHRRCIVCIHVCLMFSKSLFCAWKQFIFTPVHFCIISVKAPFKCVVKLGSCNQPVTAKLEDTRRPLELCYSFIFETLLIESCERERPRG